MIGLLFIYYIGKAFYELAGAHDKNQWGYAVLGVVSYYVGQVIGVVIILAVYALAMSGSLEDMNDLALGLMALPAGALLCWGYYRLLKSKWNRQPTFVTSEEILDADLIERRDP
jgi:hypothetical protein